MNKNLIDAFIKNGKKIHAPGDRPIILEKGYVWFISEGDIDIFSVKMRGGEAVSSRHQLFRILSKNLIFSLNSEKHKNHGFIAVGSLETYLYCIDCQTFQKFLKDDELRMETALLIDKWISSASASFQEITPHNCLDVVEKNIEIKAGIPFRAKSNLLWCSLNNQCFLPASIKLFKDTPEYPFPISNTIWFTSEIDIKLTPKNTLRFFSEKNFFDTLIHFNSIICNALILKQKKEEKQEKEQLLKKNLEDENKFTNSILKFASIFQPKKSRNRLFQELPEDPLLAACSIIGKTEDITFDTIQFLKSYPPVEPQVNHEPTQNIRTQLITETPLVTPNVKNTSSYTFSAHQNMGSTEDIGAKVRLIAETSNIRTRKVLLRNKWYKGDSGPLLGFEQKNMNPVALLPDSPKKYSLYDPQKKQKIPINKQVADTLTPFAYTFYRPFPERKLSFKDILAFSIKGNAKTIMHIAILSLLAALFGLVMPLTTGLIFNTIVPEVARNQLLQIALIVFTCSITISILSLTRSIALLRFSSKAGPKTQSAVWDRLLSLPVTFFKDYTAGDLAQRSMGINKIQRLMDNVVMTTLTNSLFSLAYLGLLFYYSVSLALLGLAISFTLIVTTVVFSLFVLRYQKPLLKLEGEIAGIILQFISAISKLRMAGAENRAFFVWANKFTRKKILTKKAGKINNINVILTSFFPILASLIIFAWVILKLTKGALSAGEYMAFNTAYLSLQSALLQMSTVFLSVISTIPIYKRLKPILETLPEVNTKKNLATKLTGNIEINNINFKYGPKEPEVLKGITLSIKSGEFVAIVGNSGCGKSTLMRLLLGFEKPNQGTIYYDNNDISSVNIKELRRQLGVVLQSSDLIQGTIYENIIGTAPLSVENAWEAARMAACDNDIKEMPMGMHTVITTGGGTISGGQKQRIMIARALVKKPVILFFDEATNALDNKTQAIVSKTIEKLHITRIVIAHRLSTIINADKIYVIKDGKIVQEGKYEQLVKQDGPFALLAKRQIL